MTSLHCSVARQHHVIAVFLNLHALGIENSIICFYRFVCFTFSFSFLVFDLCLFTEVSGQNFVDEDDGEKLRNESVPKRHKRAAADAFSNDQVSLQLTQEHQKITFGTSSAYSSCLGYNT